MCSPSVRDLPEYVASMALFLTPCRWLFLLAGMLLSPAAMYAKDVVISDVGAVADAKTLNTKAIQAAIDRLAQEGGGRLVIPKGTFRTGALFLKQGVELHLADGAVLLGSNDINDYPVRETRIEGHFQPWRVALVNASGLTALRISGAGTIDGNGILFWAAFWQRRKENPDCTNLEVERPRLMFIDRCEDVQIQGVCLANSGFWNLHLYRCRNVLIEKLNIFAPGPGTGPVRAPSSDGIDIDSSRDVVVRECSISVDDDCIALKGSRGPDADKDPDSPPVENILIERCRFGEGHGVVTLGSEAAIVRNVRVRDCVVEGKNNLVRLKLRTDTPQLYEDLTYENIQLNGKGRIFDVRPWSQFEDLKGRPAPSSTVRNVVVKNVTGAFGTFGRISGNPTTTLVGLRVENVTATLDDPKLTLGKVTDLIFDNVTINGQPYKP
jgi:polygalacturonase